VNWCFRNKKIEKCSY